MCPALADLSYVVDARSSIVRLIRAYIQEQLTSAVGVFRIIVLLVFLSLQYLRPPDCHGSLQCDLSLAQRCYRCQKRREANCRKRHLPASGVLYRGRLQLCLRQLDVLRGSVSSELLRKTTRAASDHQNMLLSSYVRYMQRILDLLISSINLRPACRRDIRTSVTCGHLLPLCRVLCGQPGKQRILLLRIGAQAADWATFRQEEMDNWIWRQPSLVSGIFAPAPFHRLLANTA